MKLNLLINNDMVRSGYINLDPFADGTHPDKTRGDVTKLDDIVDDAEATEIVALDVIDFLPVVALESSIANWIKKLRRGGTIVIGGVDVVLVAKALSRHDIDISHANLLLYGSQTTPCDYRKSTLTLLTLVDIFQTNGLKVVHKKVDGYNYIVKAERM